ncbi:hypothetical protein J6590_001859 [Homalodisca vitripennis]|nr:hypothetical protein J6590_001859 [Homalodisca vitripennis]
MRQSLCLIPAAASSRRFDCACAVLAKPIDCACVVPAPALGRLVIAFCAIVYVTFVRTMCKCQGRHIVTSIFTAIATYQSGIMHCYRSPAAAARFATAVRLMRTSSGRIIN